MSSGSAEVLITVNGKPGKNIEVDLWTLARPGKSTTAYVTFTDGRGRASFVGLAPGTYYTSSNATTFPREYGNANESWDTSSGIEIVQGKVAQKKVALISAKQVPQPTGLLTPLNVIATDNTGKPVGGVEIALTTNGLLFRTGKTGSDGKARFSLPAGMYMLGVTSDTIPPNLDYPNPPFSVEIMAGRANEKEIIFMYKQGK